MSYCSSREGCCGVDVTTLTVNGDGKVRTDEVGFRV